jgi:hypothetical protein
MTERQPQEIAVRWKVRICRAAFGDAHGVLPRLVGRAELRRQAFKLEWWDESDEQLFDLSWKPVPNTPMRVLAISDSYGFAAGFHVVFSPIEPDETLWVIAVMRSDEEMTDAMKRIFQARLNIILERKDISHDNPFGDL